MRDALAKLEAGEQIPAEALQQLALRGALRALGSRRPAVVANASRLLAMLANPTLPLRVAIPRAINPLDSSSTSRGSASRPAMSKFKATPPGQGGGIVRSLLLTGAAEVPGISTIAGYLERRMQDATNEAMERSIRLLGMKLNRMAERISKECVSTEDFGDLLLGWMAVMDRTQREEKLRAAANLVANQLLVPGDPERIEPSEADLFMRAIEQLSKDALAVLGAAYLMGKYEGRDDLGADSVRLQFAVLCTRFPKTDPHLIVGLIGELDRFGLLHRDSRPVVRSARYEDQPFDLTPLGVRFIDRLVKTD